MHPGAEGDVGAARPWLRRLIVAAAAVALSVGGSLVLESAATTHASAAPTTASVVPTLPTTTTPAPQPAPPTTAPPTTAAPPPTTLLTTTPPTTAPAPIHAVTAAAETSALRPPPPPVAPGPDSCAVALAYLAANAAPGFHFECPGYALGHQAMTCVNVAGVCPGTDLIAINVVCPASYMNEAHNSWILSGRSTGRIDPFGYCH